MESFCYFLPILTVYFVFFGDTLALANCKHKVLKRDKGECCKNDILKVHNNYRKMSLKGEIPGQPAAKEMNMLKWDQSLAEAAQQVTDTCVFKHVAINSTKFKWVGQNMYAISYQRSKNFAFNYTLGIKNWYNEYKYYNYPDGPSKKTTHYTQLLWASTKYVGCASTMYVTGKWTNKFYVCNYGRGGNVQGQPPYKTR